MVLATEIRFQNDELIDLDKFIEMLNQIRATYGDGSVIRGPGNTVDQCKCLMVLGPVVKK